MIKTELRKISLQYRTLSSQLLGIDTQEELNYMQMYFEFITATSVIYDFICECHHNDYDFVSIFKEKEWNDILTLPSNQVEIVDYGYQLLQYILDGPKQIIGLTHGYTSSRKISDNITAFMRKTIEPFVVAVRSYLELCLVDCEDTATINKTMKKTIFLSYCQKDSDIADLVDKGIFKKVGGKATISRDIRDVEYHQSFKKFMKSIESHDFVLMIISDRYLKSRNCLFEVLEVVKDSHFGNKLAFIVLCDDDKKYIKNSDVNNIGANVYSTAGQTNYSLYWRNEEVKLQNQINEIGDPTYAIAQIKEMKTIKHILLDLPEFLEFISEHKGEPLEEHIKNGFYDMIKFMDI